MNNTTTPAPLSAEQLAYQRVREEFELAVKLGARFDINSAMLNVDYLIAQARAAQPAQAEVAAWMTEDGERVVSAATKAGQERDGGASASAMRPYTVALIRAAQAHHAAASERARELANVIDYLIANGHMRWEGFDDDDEGFSSNSAEFQAILSLVKAALPYRAAATTGEDARELYAVLQMVADELNGCSFSMHKAREGNSNVWRYIGKGEEVARRVRETLTKNAAMFAPNAIQKERDK